MYLFIFFFVFFVYFENFSEIIFVYAVFLFLVIMVREFVKDLQNIKGAIANNYSTFPVVYGEKKTKQLVFRNGGICWVRGNAPAAPRPPRGRGSGAEPALALSRQRPETGSYAVLRARDLFYLAVPRLI